MKQFVFVKEMSSGSLKNVCYKLYNEIIYLMYMYKKDLALNDQQCLIYHKTKANKPQVFQTLWSSSGAHSYQNTVHYKS